jgi:hypothetical protein
MRKAIATAKATSNSSPLQRGVGEKTGEHPAACPLAASSSLGFVLDGLLPPYSHAIR